MFKMDREKLTEAEQKEVIKKIDEKVEQAIAKTDLNTAEKKEVIKVVNNKIKEKLFGKAVEFKKEFKKQLSTAIMAAFGLIIALSWRDVINDAVADLSFIKSYGLLLTAIVMTLISVIAIFLISQWAKAGEIK